MKGADRKNDKNRYFTDEYYRLPGPFSVLKRNKYLLSASRKKLADFLLYRKFLPVCQKDQFFGQKKGGQREKNR